jgi:hypothetical protein
METMMQATTDTQFEIADAAREMKLASPEVAAAARWHIGAADEEGVAIALEQIAEAARESHRQGVEVLPAFMRER